MPRHSWTKEDNKICSESYLKGLKPSQTHLLLPHISLNSIKRKYGNCKFLEKGKVSGALPHVTDLHIDVWKSLENKLENNFVIKEYNMSSDPKSPFNKEQINELKHRPPTRVISAEANGAVDYGPDGTLVRYVDGKWVQVDESEYLDEASFRKKIAEQYGESMKIDETFIKILFGNSNQTSKQVTTEK
jgi:hypothetical protein